MAFVAGFASASLGGPSDKRKPPYVRTGVSQLNNIRLKGSVMDFSNSSDQVLSVYYESVRQQVAADGTNRYRFMGPSVKQYAESLREEMDHRRLNFTPIDWPAA